MVPCASGHLASGWPRREKANSTATRANTAANSARRRMLVFRLSREFIAFFFTYLSRTRWSIVAINSLKDRQDITHKFPSELTAIANQIEEGPMHAGVV